MKRPPFARPIVDLVIDDYRSLREGNTRLSAADRQRLDEHLDRLAELERKVAMVRDPAPISGVSCEKLPARPTLQMQCGGGRETCAGDLRAFVDVVTDLIATAFMCGVTRVASLDVKDSLVPNFSGDWHNDAAHKGNQQLLGENNRNIFTSAVVKLAGRLDVEEANGRTFLDNSLIMYTNENGYSAHHSKGIPLLTMGSAGGFFKTGQLIDFRKTASDPSSFGITYNQFLAIVLQSMGLARSEFEKGGQQGYGRMKIGVDYVGKFVPEAISQASRVPELMKA